MKKFVKNVSPRLWILSTQGKKEGSQLLEVLNEMGSRPLLMLPRKNFPVTKKSNSGFCNTIGCYNEDNTTKILAEGEIKKMLLNRDKGFFPIKALAEIALETQEDGTKRLVVVNAPLMYRSVIQRKLDDLKGSILSQDVEFSKQFKSLSDMLKHQGYNLSIRAGFRVDCYICLNAGIDHTTRVLEDERCMRTIKTFVAKRDISNLYSMHDYLSELD
jgi:hypothetical protein